MSSQLMDHPPRHGTDDRDTSVAAAETNSRGRFTMAARLLDAYYMENFLKMKVFGGEFAEGLNWQEAAEKCKIDVQSSPWKRIGELEALGLLVDTGRVSMTKKNCPATVYAIASHAAEAIGSSDAPLKEMARLIRTAKLAVPKKSLVERALAMWAKMSQEERAEFGERTEQPLLF